ncbi:MFS transporter [Umezawaea endophytica]|uniref:MFS transporter n=1 Tax=Umezawaea endophytica TaxID=1654476 RepID=A0A9X2VP85_9PSEU|nr:MFS transporter [Umezawaea endophytica]MCS7480351.1 MFS transporter [Umezawaea endophytica]
MRTRLAVVALGAGVAEFGDIAFLIGIATSLYGLSGSAAVVGFGMAAYGVGSLVGALVGGVLIDALPPRPWLLWGNASGGALLACFTVAAALPVVVALIAVISLASRAMLVAQQSCLPLVEPDRLLRANSVVMSCRRVGQLFGPAAAGGLVALGSGTAVYWVNAATFVLNGAIGFLAVPAGGRVRARWVGERREGALAYSARTPAARTAFAVNCVVGVVTGTTTVTLIVYTTTVLHGGPSEYGLLATFAAVGAVLGTFTATAVGRRVELRTAVVATVAVAGVALIALPFADRFAVAAALRVASGWSLNVLMILLMANLHEGAPEDLRGRMIASTRSGLDALMITFTMVSGFLVAVVGVRWVLVGVGGVTALCAAVLARTADPFRWLPRTGTNEVSAR